MKKTIPILLLLTAVLSLAGCKKEESTTTKASLSGAVLSDATPFVREGNVQNFSVDISGLYTSDDSDPGTLGMVWVVNGSLRDTTTRDLSKSNPSFAVTADKVGTVTVVVNIFALNGSYYDSSVSTSFQVIDPETALTGIEGTADTAIGTQKYPTIEAGGLLWMASNLYGTESGRDYRDCEVVSSLFGRYYTWEEALTACPDGWRLPTAAEFDASLGEASGELMVNAAFMTTDMWPYWPQVKITNSLGFNAIPTGYIDNTTSQEVFGYREYALWWTADENEEEDLGVYRYIYEEEEKVMKGKGSKNTLSLNVRCVKEI